MDVVVEHRLPGRLRVAIEGIRNEPVRALQLESRLAQIDGVLTGRCSARTGRALVCFDPRIISESQIVQDIGAWLTRRPDVAVPAAAVAAAIESSRIPMDALMPRAAALPVTDTNPYLVPAVASSGLLAVLAVKRLLVGRSALATAPWTLWASAAVAIASGYPALRDSAEQLIRTRKASPDLWLGLVALGFAAIRENIVALSAITALHIAMYRRHAVLAAPEDTVSSPELARHSQRMGRLSLWLTPATLLFTRSPLRALAVALAANPRPALLAHKYRWAQAEREAWDQHLLTHTPGGLSALAVANTIVFADDEIVRSGDFDWQIHPVSDHSDKGKVLALAASLVKANAEHPWRPSLLQRARAQRRTLHAAFDVTQETEGIRGRVQGYDMMLGTRRYIQQRGVDDTTVLMAQRRLQRQGYEAQVLVVDQQPVAVLACRREISPIWQQTLETWANAGYQTVALRHRGPLADHLGSWTPDQLQGHVETGATSIWIGRGQPPLSHPRLIPVHMDDASRLPETLAFCRTRTRFVSSETRTVRLWNLLAVTLALAAPVSAPFLAIAGDVVAMYLLAAQHWRTRSARARPRQAMQRTAAEAIESFHAMSAAAVMRKFDTGPKGLTLHQITERQALWGSNVLVPPSAPPAWRLFIQQFRELSTLILLGTAILSFMTGERFSALCMLCILILNAAVATWQEKRSTAVILALKTDEPLTSTVIRDGREHMVSTTDLVPGDIVLLAAGDKVPADIRIAESWGLETSEAMLTGESLPVMKQATTLTEQTALADRDNLLYMGTAITRGRCKGVVVAIGAQTQIGTLESLVNTREEKPTFLQTRVTQISKRFVVGAFVAASVVAVTGFMRGMPPMSLLISSVTLAASAIPEGLPLTITVALTAGILQMTRRRAVVKKLDHLESLGRVTVICCDKTGTLTRNEMTVKELVTVGQRLPMSNRSALRHPDTAQLLTIGVLCNNAQLDASGQPSTGDPMEAALLAAAAQAGMQANAWKRQREIPFDASTRSMSVVCEEHEQTNVVCEDGARPLRCSVFTKGACEIILTKCTHYLQDGVPHPLSTEVEDRIRNENVQLANQALRVLAFAYRDVAADENPMEATDENLVFVGLMGMLDPPRDGVFDSIQRARRLGIRPIMITGDHPLTARAIGHELSIFCTGDQILTGLDIDRMTPDMLDREVVNTTVFARVSPQHKLQIVQAFQRIGEVVAMTGDGVNDAPAMHSADVSIAMGSKGTDITKGAAGIVLLEDHFHSIVDGVIRGRAIIGNIRRAMGCLLAGNLAEVIVTAVSIVIGLPMPLIPLQILLMNILTDAVPAMVLATGSQTDVPDQPYRDVIDAALYKTVVIRGCVLGLGAVAVFASALAAGMSLPLAQTMTYASLVVGQLILTAAWRQYEQVRKVRLHTDRVLLGASIGSWLALAATIYVPALRAVFATVPLRLHHWGIVLVVTGALAWCSQWWISRSVPVRIVPSPSVVPTFAQSM